MSLAIAAKAGRIIETLENYSVNEDTIPIDGNSSPEGTPSFYSDESFWRSFMREPEKFWNKKLSFYDVVVSDWVARVPGLYWAKNSAQYRNAAVKEAEFRSETWKVYTPQGKSSIVMGGIGDFVLPPSDDGKTIMTISFSHNASTGIPVLIHQEVIDHHQVKQGDLINVISATWRKMSLEWSSRFPSFGDIKRGYLVIDHPEQVKVNTKNQPVEFHPCTIMEYSSGDALLYDFVFCTADTAYKNYRGLLEKFFTDYKNDQERFGRYLLAADSSHPLFESDYLTPLDLQRAEPDGRSQLILLTERIQNTFYHRGETLDTLLKNIPKFYPTYKEILTLAVDINVPRSELHVSSATKMTAQLVELCLHRKIVETLVDRMLADHPELINQ